MTVHWPSSLSSTSRGTIIFSLWVWYMGWLDKVIPTSSLSWTFSEHSDVEKTVRYIWSAALDVAGGKFISKFLLEQLSLLFRFPSVRFAFCLRLWPLGCSMWPSSWWGHISRIASGIYSLDLSVSLFGPNRTIGKGSVLSAGWLHAKRYNLQRARQCGSLGFASQFFLALETH